MLELGAPPSRIHGSNLSCGIDGHIGYIFPEFGATEGNPPKLGTIVASSPSRAMSKSILLVEDDSDIRESLAYLLSDEGYDVACAENGQEALKYLHEGLKPALILLDVMMPKMNGYEFREAQKQEPELAAIPVIVLSAADNVTQRAKSMDAVMGLTKPVRMEQLVKAIQAVC